MQMACTHTHTHKLSYFFLHWGEKKKPSAGPRGKGYYMRAQAVIVKKKKIYRFRKKNRFIFFYSPLSSDFSLSLSSRSVSHIGTRSGNIVCNMSIRYKYITHNFILWLCKWGWRPHVIHANVLTLVFF